MADIIISETDEPIIIEADSHNIIIEEKEEDLIVCADETKITVNETDSIDIIIDVAGSYVISSGIVPDIFYPTFGQTIFTLSFIPVGVGILTLRTYLNGQKLPTGSYSISGSQLTIILPYDLEVSDILETYY
jgi:hypothetical protein